jgi:hypothetical protein
MAGGRVASSLTDTSMVVWMVAIVIVRWMCATIFFTP